jgi:type IV pilus assembly protein PilM
MKNLLKIKERLSFGLDIGTQSIKYIKLRFHNKDSVRLCGFGLIPAGSDLTEALKGIKQSEGIDAVNISVSGPSAVIRNVSFPRMSQNELRQALKFEVQKHIPFSVEEVNIDSCVIKENLPDNKMLVLIAAVKKDMLNQRLKIVQDAGFKVNIVDIDSLSLLNAFNFNYSIDEALKNKALLLLNIGSSVTNLNILENGIPRLSRDIQIGGYNFNQRLMEAFSLDLGSAQELKINTDSDKIKQINTALEPLISNLCASIRTSIDYYESQAASAVAKVFLSGGEANSCGLKESFKNFLGIEVECWDPLKKISIENSVDPAKVKAISSQLAVALGLALRV